MATAQGLLLYDDARGRAWISAGVRAGIPYCFRLFRFR